MITGDEIEVDSFAGGLGAGFRPGTLWVPGSARGTAHSQIGYGILPSHGSFAFRFELYSGASMTTILLFTGNAGPGVAIAAAATALRSARRGDPTLLLSLGSARGLGALLDADVGSTPAPVANRLEALAIDGLADLAAAWERGRAHLPSQVANIAGDELPLLPGLEMSFALLRLSELAPRYATVVLDAGAHDGLLRALAQPDGLRWAVRLLFGLDRGPGRSPASVARAVLPTSFLPLETLDNVQALRVEAERLRGLLTAPGAASTRFVLRPDRPALEEARVAIPALQLHGLAVPAIVVGPLLPGGFAGTSLAAQQAAVLAEAGASWPRRSLLHFAHPKDDAGLAALEAIGEQIDHAEPAPVAPPIAEVWEGAPAIAIELPGMPPGVLGLTLSGDELIVRVGQYRRHILLPDALRGTSAIRATREGERLIVRRRDR
jgi:arsenite/tail-anchored protein-transporting ATPase